MIPAKGGGSMFNNRKEKFGKWIAQQEIAAKSVGGSDYSLRAAETDIRKSGFSDIVSRLLNEKKAVRDSGYIYIDPYYQMYDRPGRDGKLLQNVKSDAFRTMINQSEILCYRSDEHKGIFHRLSQKEVRRYNCIQIMAQLIRKNLAFLDDLCEYIYLDINFQNVLEKKSNIPSDLSNFRTMMGEGRNLKDILDLLEEADTVRTDNGEIRIVLSQSIVKDYGFQTQLYSLLDIGIAQLDVNNQYLLCTELSTWLLDYVEHACDRMSFAALYESAI